MTQSEMIENLEAELQAARADLAEVQGRIDGRQAECDADPGCPVRRRDLAFDGQSMLAPRQRKVDDLERQIGMLRGANA